MERIGKFPTLCKSAAGFVANRIQFAMAAEALKRKRDSRLYARLKIFRNENKGGDNA
jgi:3-hydroxyacyl-CoA dehydrogenase